VAAFAPLGLFLTGSRQEYVLSIPVVVSITLLCSHLSHGIASIFQTLGARSARNEKSIQQLGLALAVVLWLGFVSIPLAIVTRVYTDPLAEEAEPATEIQSR